MASKKVFITNEEFCAFARISGTTFRRKVANEEIAKECGLVALSELRKISKKSYSYAKKCLELKSEIFKDEQ